MKEALTELNFLAKFAEMSLEPEWKDSMVKLVQNERCSPEAGCSELESSNIPNNLIELFRCNNKINFTKAAQNTLNAYIVNSRAT